MRRDTRNVGIIDESAIGSSNCLARIGSSSIVLASATSSVCLLPMCAAVVLGTWLGRNLHEMYVTLTPRWESVEDMGNEDKATGYTCEACGEHFSAAEGHALQRSQADRVREISTTE